MGVVVPTFPPTISFQMTHKGPFGWSKNLFGWRWKSERLQNFLFG